MPGRKKSLQVTSYESRGSVRGVGRHDGTYRLSPSCVVHTGCEESVIVLLEEWCWKEVKFARREFMSSTLDFENSGLRTTDCPEDIMLLKEGHVSSRLTSQVKCVRG